MTQAPKQNQRWREDHSVPASLTAPQFVLEPLHAKHAELDFAALMSCRQRLRDELQWGEWPPADFTLSINRADLQEHHDEFVRGEAFAYTVLRSDHAQCLGCIYLERCDAVDGAQLAFWVIEDALDIEALLVQIVLHWAHTTWAIKQILLPLRPNNVRGIALARTLGLAPWDSEDSPLPDHKCFLSVAEA